jgi:hypothetical protein
MSAFSFCVSLESIVFPESVIGIEFKAFYYCKKLRNVIFKNPNTIYDITAFLECIYLQLNTYKEGTYLELKDNIKYNLEKCPITYDEFNDNSIIILLKCGHFFMKKAFDSWSKIHNICPLCRK